MSASITFLKDGITTDVYLYHAQNLSRVEEFAMNLAQYTSSGIDQASFASSVQINLAQNDAKDAFLMPLYAKILLRQRSTGKLYGVLIYAPITSMFYYVEGRGYRVKESDGDQVAAWYSTMAGGENFDYDDGWLCGTTRQV